MKKKLKGKKSLNLPRVHLPQQTGGHHGAGRGPGSYNRQKAKLALRKGGD